MAARDRPAADSDAMKNRRRTTTKTKRPSAPKVGGRRKPPSTNADTKIALLKRERDEASEQQKATAEVLRVISASPGDLKPIFAVILENATRLCQANFGVLFLCEGDAFRAVAMHNAPSAYVEARQREPLVSMTGTTVIAEVARTKRTIQTADMAKNPAYRKNPQYTQLFVRLTGARSFVGVPMLKDDALIGVIGIFRQEVRSFTDKQIELVENFAAQAVIAIENTRLLNELRESLEQQTATSAVLSVISSSRGDLEPVFEAMLENATRICEAKFGTLYLRDGEAYRAASMCNAPPAFAEYRRRGPIHPGPSTGLGRVTQTKQLVHIADITSEQAYIEGDPIFVTAVEAGGFRTVLHVPMLNEENLVGVIAIYRQEMHPFTDKQIALLQNFAAQAVIAIENTRLLNELRQSLEQQTATSEILEVISNSPTDTQPAFDAIVRSGLKLFPQAVVVISLPDSGMVKLAAIDGADRDDREALRARYPMPLSREYITATAILDGQEMDFADVRETPTQFIPGRQNFLASGYRAITVMPMSLGETAIGAISVVRRQPGALSDKQRQLLRTFARQAVIAIENTRLFNELRQSLEQQTATAEVLSVISSSPGELKPVFESMLENAVRICEAKFGTLQLCENGAFYVAAMHNPPPAYAASRRSNPLVKPSPHNALGRVIATKRLVHIADYAQELAYKQGDPAAVSIVELAGARTFIIVPMLKEGELIGNLVLYRQEVRPFTDKQIALLTNFAAQAVIAIENTRLLSELRQSLEQQTATADVLKVISSSPGELEPVFQAMLENATRICAAEFGTLYRYDGGMYHIAAEIGTPAEYSEVRRQRGPFAPRPGGLLDKVTQTKQTTHTADDAAQDSMHARLGGARSRVCVPMLKDDVLVGAISIYRQEVRPFADKQIELLENFAAQAVIAIENTRLLNELRQRTDDLSEALEQQTATSEVLRVISSSPSELPPVFEAMLRNAVRICDANFGNVFRWDGTALNLVAAHNTPPAYSEARRRSPLRPDPSVPMGRVIATKSVVHIADLSTEQGYAERKSGITAAIEVGGVRTLLAIPMLKEDELVGIITIYRQEVRPFTDRQVELVQNFAAQAVIAIENTRLLNELRQSLEQQTATAEVLSVISSSPGELEPVFQAMLENAVRICEAKFGQLYRFEEGAFHLAAGIDIPPDYAEFLKKRGPFLPPAGSQLDRAMRTKRASYTADMAADATPGSPARLGGARSAIAVPMLKDDDLIGAIIIYRQEVRPFTEKQIALVENFAAQAVIAIENTRLLNELRESLEQQTATSQVLSVISSSPGELEPVFQAMLENATRICEAKFGTMYFREGDGFRAVAMHGAPPAYVESRLHKLVHPGPATGIGRVLQTKQAVQIEDASADQGYSERDPMRVSAVELGGVRTLLDVPMLKDNEVIGAVAIYREVVRPFTDKQVALVQNFANQAVIAIENTRLLNELRESLQQQTATSEVLGVISSSPGELTPVFDAMLANAVRICNARFGNLQLFDGKDMRIVAMHNAPREFAELRRDDPVVPLARSILGPLVETKKVFHVADLAAEEPFASSMLTKLAGARTALAVPMLREGELVGGIAIYHQEVRPFTNKQIELVQNFAAQAVIAIENSRGC